MHRQLCYKRQTKRHPVVGVAVGADVGVGAAVAVEAVAAAVVAAAVVAAAVAEDRRQLQHQQLVGRADPR